MCNSILVNLLSDMVGLSRCHSGSCVNSCWRREGKECSENLSIDTVKLCTDILILLTTLNINVCVIEWDSS